MCFCKILENLFSCFEKFFESFLGNEIGYLIIEFSSRDAIVVKMCRKWKSMELGNTIFFYYLYCIEEVLFSFSWKSDDKVSSNIESDTIISIEQSELS